MPRARTRRSTTSVAAAAPSSPVADAEAPVSRLEVADTPTLFLTQSPPVGYTVHANLYFVSEAWITPLRQDVEALCEAFEQEWENEINSSSTGGEGREGSGNGRPSPFELFRELWVRLGWDKVHLLAVPEGPLRGWWGDSVMRAFVDRLKAEEKPLKQVAAFFAIYTFFATQAEKMEKVFVKLDPLTLEYTLSLPAQLAASLDSAPDLITPPPSADLSCVLHTLLSSDAFLLLPAQVCTGLTLPCVSLVDTSQAENADLATLLLGVANEAEALREGQFSGVARRALLTAAEEAQEDDDEEEHEEEEEASHEPDLPDWGAQSLRLLASGYLEAKTSSATSPGESDPLSSSTTWTAKPRSDLSTIFRPRNALQEEVLLAAEGLTREVVERLGAAAGGLAALLPPKDQVEREGSARKRRTGLMDLVDAEGGGGGRRKRSKVGCGLGQFEALLDQQ
ncbi:hypothetical protein JCM11641_004053 [Rhodosporidiobolus odoratus]